MSGIIDGISSLTSAFQAVFSFLPGGWGEIIVAGISLYLAYVVLKVILDIIGTFF